MHYVAFRHKRMLISAGVNRGRHRQFTPSRVCRAWKRGCACSKLESDVLMMEAAENWNRCDTANLLDPAKIRSIFLQ